MAKRRTTAIGQVLLFPPSGTEAHSVVEALVVQPPASHAKSTPEPVEIVICGSFRKDIEGLKNTFQELLDLGFTVLSPLNANITSEKEGFVFMEGEQTESPESIELRHLQAITRAAFVWLHAPEGYIGPSAALEIGFARANGIPVYTVSPLREAPFQPLVTVVPSVRDIAPMFWTHPHPPIPTVQAFQAYYARAALRRGYEKESAQDTLLLMLEEFGELARAIRKRAALRRDSTGAITPVEQELADVFIYVVHMANVLGLDLAEAVRAKEDMNIRRFLSR
jgi:NTP pyrophosphatase (non-canonical NTP hydrolase)